MKWMISWWAIAGLAVASASCFSVAYLRAHVRDGSSVQRAIIIKPADNQLDQEYAWIANHPKGATFPVEQALFCVHGRLFEKWTFGTSNQREVYFDLGMNDKICDAKSEYGFAK
jgi:hypothetical protein